VKLPVPITSDTFLSFGLWCEQVPGNISLQRLSVLLKAAFGWCTQDYHSFLFKTPTGEPFGMGRGKPGTLLFGEVNSRSIDTMHKGMWQMDCEIDAGKVLISDVLHHISARIDWLYDIGDQYKHRVSLVEVQCLEITLLFC
jgi:hypothetical protein